MNVARHRIAAGAILLCGGLGAATLGRTMARDSPAVARIRHELDGRWVATRVQSVAACVAEGPAAATATIEFAGPAVRFTGLVDGGDAAGTYVLGPAAHPGRVDFKVATGWIRGIFRREGDRLTLCVNAIRPLEHLGVPSRAYPTEFRPMDGRYLYEFRRARP